VKQLYSFIGWSTGAIVGLACSTLHPHITSALFLFNTSLGLTLHGMFQLIHPLPRWIQRYVSEAIHGLIDFLRPVIDTPAWDTLKALSSSKALRVMFELISFLGGFPPEQALFFKEYAKDIFFSRSHTHALMDLIAMTDEPLPEENLEQALKGVQSCVLISGFFDFMTGVYCTHELHRILSKHDAERSGGKAAGGTKKQRSKHVMFTMGSHFILLEWPEVVAKELLDHLNGIEDTDSNTEQLTSSSKETKVRSKRAVGVAVASPRGRSRGEGESASKDAGKAGSRARTRSVSAGAESRKHR
jgi:pimeloyl-ACP methyl ester carboxylesterase